MSSDRVEDCLRACEGMANPEHEVRGLRADAAYLVAYREAYCALVTRDSVLRDAAAEAVRTGDLKPLSAVLAKQREPLTAPVRT